MNDPEPPPRYPLRGTVTWYVDPTAPVAEEDWEALKPEESAGRSNPEASSTDSASDLLES